MVPVAVSLCVAIANYSSDSAVGQRYVFASLSPQPQLGAGHLTGLCDGLFSGSSWPDYGAQLLGQIAA